MPDELVSEWVQKAEEDWIGIERLGADDLAPVANLVVFLAQQCAEKYLKALISQEGVEPPRVHILAFLLDAVVSGYADLETLRPACEQLSRYAVAYRYPGQRATRDEAEDAVAKARSVRAAIRIKLVLE